MKKILSGFLSLGMIGYIPLLPGTFASIFGCLFLLFFPSRPLYFDLFLLISLFLFSSLAIYHLGFEEKDPRHVVIDEFIGMYVTILGHPANFRTVLGGFILFRFFDIIKPYPVNKIEELPGPFGILGDDIFAGIYANLSLYLIKNFAWKLF